MPNISIKIINLKEIKAAFARAPHLVGREINKAIKQSIFTIERESKQRTPVDTGRLRASTYTRFRALYGEVGTNTNYDIFVHEGTRFMRARPYLRQAVESNLFNVQRFFTEGMQRVLNQIGRMT